MRPVRYALWSLLVIAPAILILSAFGGTLAGLREPIGADTGLMAMTASAVALAVTALIAPGIAHAERPGLPDWAAGLTLAAALQVPAAILIGIGSPASSVWSHVYVPGAFVCLDILALMLTHVWVASDGMGRSPSVGLATGGAYGAWVLRIGSAQGFDLFVGVSCVAAALAFIAATAVALNDAARPAPAGN